MTHPVDGDGAADTRARRPDRRTGWWRGARSSTRCTSAALPTRTATASATWPEFASGSPTCATSASTPSGSTRGTPRRWPTRATTSRTTASIDPAFGTLAEAEQLIAEARALGHPHDRRHRPEPRLGPAPVVPRRPGRTARIAGAGALLVPAGAGLGRRAAAERLAVDLRRLGVDAHRERGRCPASGTSTCSRPSSPTSTGRIPTSGPSTRTSFASGSTAASAGVRIDSAALLVKDPRPRRGRRPEHAAGEHPFMDRDELHDIYRRWRAIADGYDEPRLLVGEVWLPDAGASAPATCARTSCTQRSTSTSWRARGSRRRCATSIESALARACPVGRADDLGAVEPRRDEAGDALRPRRHVVLVRVEAGRHTDRHRARHPARASGRAARDGAAGLDVHLPGRGARACRRSRTSRHERRQDPMWHRSGGVDPGRDGCRIPLPWDGDRAAVRIQPRRAPAGPWLDQPEDWAELTVAAQSGRPDVDALPLPRPALRLRRAAPWSATGRSAGCRSDDAVLAFARGERFACIVNFGPDPVDAALRRRRPHRQQRARRRCAPARHRRSGSARRTRIG